MPAQIDETAPLKVTRAQAVNMFQALGLKMADGWRRSRMQEKLNKLPEEFGDAGDEIEDEKARAVYDAVVEALGDGREVDLVVGTDGGEAADASPAKTKKKPAAPAEDAPDAEEVETNEDGDELVPVHDKKPKAGKNGKPKEKAEKVEKTEKPVPKAERPVGTTKVRKIEGTESFVAGRVFGKLGLAEVTDKHKEQAHKQYKGSNSSRTTYIYSARSAILGWLGEGDKTTRNQVAGRVVKEMGIVDEISPAAIAAVNKQFGKENDTESRSALVKAVQAIAGYKHEKAKESE